MSNDLKLKKKKVFCHHCVKDLTIVLPVSIVVIIFIYLIGSQQWNSSVVNGKAPGNIGRWYNFIKSLGHVDTFLASVPEEAKPKLAITDQAPGRSGRKEEGKFVELPGAEMGKVVVRFPPEASG